MESEEWRDVVGFERLYEVSDHGRVRRAVNSKRSPGTRPGKMRKIVLDGRYPAVTLRSNGHTYIRKVHILVAFAFIGPRPKGLVINHIDGIRTNNHPSNLEFVTHRRNSNHAVEIGILKIKGESNHNAKLSEHQVRDIIRSMSSGSSNKELSDAHCISEQTISGIRHCRVWRHITRPKKISQT